MSLRRVLDRKAVKSAVLLSNAQIYRLEAVGKFPRRVRVGISRVGYFEDEIADWLATRARGSDRT